MAEEWLPNLDSLRCFLALADRRNFRRAAQQVGLSPAAFSERIKQLELDLGVELFDRSTRRVEITGAGARLQDRVKSLVADAAGLRELARDDDVALPYALTIGTRFELGLSWLVPALAGLRAAHPERRVHLAFGDGPELLAGVEAGTVDALVASVRLTRADLAYALLHEEDYTLVGAPSLLDARPLDQPEDAREHVLLDLHADLPLFRYFLDAAPAEETWRFGAREYLGTIAAVRYRAREGAGIAVLPTYYVAGELEDGSLRAAHPRVKLSSDWFRLVWRAGHPRDAALRSLAEELRDLPLR